LVNFDLHLSEPKILEIMAKNNVFDVYWRLLDWSSERCPERDQPNYFIYCESKSTKNFLVDITPEKHSEIYKEWLCLLDQADGVNPDVPLPTHKLPTQPLDPGVNEQDTAGPAGWSRPAGWTANQLANSHESASGEPRSPSPIDELGRDLKRSSSPDQLSGRMVKRLKK
jgi:hypothetical protein